jgi:hypothetical protein
MSAILSRLVLAVALLAALAGCSRSDRDEWPARNYSAAYSVTAKVVSNDCPAPVFAQGDTLVFALLQSKQNGARVDVAPVASLTGDFKGDHLDAYAAVSAAPTASVPAASGSDASEAGPGGNPIGSDSVRYRMSLDFEGHAFKGTYSVEQPSLGKGAEACKQAFEVRGTERPDGADQVAP